MIYQLLFFGETIMTWVKWRWSTSPRWRPRGL